MRTKKIPDFKYFLLIVMIGCGCIGGGYFCYVSAVLSVLLLGALVYQLWCAKRLLISCDINLLAFSLISVSYFLVSLWAVDSGMSLMGGMKFLPVILLFLLMCQITEAERQELIGWLPLAGSVMTVLSFLMMQIPACKTLVSTAGRLGGFFQYPNTYALFMLICFIVAVLRLENLKKDWRQAVHCLIALFGIYLSGSRTVFALMLLCILLLLAWKKENRKYLFLCVGIFTAVLAVIFAVGGSGLMERLTTLSDQASTFWGRLLYARDAVVMIAKYPFGMGYYGYYFVQQEMQTGVYSVVSVHNEFLQLILDVGIFPAICFYGAILKSLFDRRKQGTEKLRDKLVLLVVLLHSLFDYDFQFLVMYGVLMLFLSLKDKKEIKLSMASTVAVGIGLLAVSAGAIAVGGSDYLYMQNRLESSIQFYEGNTMAKIGLLLQAEDSENMGKTADSILEANEHVPVAYSAKARAAFADGDVDAFIDNKLTAIRLGPYHREEYTDYMETLAWCEQEFLKTGDTKSAAYCLERAEEIPEMLEEVKERTSTLGWKIKDQPETEISQEEQELLEEMRAM
ncbi:O-antigen ligase family protein [Dorea acetigenes]|uniref:O-antigen ligase family protein n=1 Tax=Dorea acetigenes TaxID=2981787 RepID=A0ABT2RQY5_9FIRM|nr:O-antigen ligase family protein [Dorea acetigenes]MCU6687666.1 O-antigen ligase family protein [Dorea acetigenes]SCJ51366.1 Lipid A core-O-antigen ligase and related enzymes [uncultured Clostridium sp.]